MDRTQENSACETKLYLFGLKLGLTYLFSGKFLKGIARLLCPIHYTRYKELPLTLSMLDPSGEEKILDISSPKILSIFLAKNYGSHIFTTDILEQPLEEAAFFKDKFALENLRVQKEDARHLSFPDSSFDKIFSVSVFEHIAPARKGELPAIREAARALKPGGILILTLAFADTYFEEYKKGTVYEREALKNENNFFQRFYNDGTLEENIIGPSGLELQDKAYVGEAFYTKSPGSSLANVIDAGFLKTFFFGPFQKLFADCFLREDRNKNNLKKPVIVCLKLKKP